jgi:hypothetical protein
MTRADIALLVGAATIMLIAILAGNAVAAPASCIDSRRSYVARPLNATQVWVQNAIGEKKPPIRLSTTCHHLQSTIAVSISAQMTCIDRGDPVIATAGGERQSCVVTKVEAYAPADGDVPEKK